MKPVDLHPEELLDGGGRDEDLSPEDRARLGQHLAACAACAFERSVVRDFADGLQRPEPGDDRAAAEALAGALEDPRVRARLAGGAIGRGFSGTRGHRMFLIGALMLAAGVGAAAAAWYAIAVLAQRAPAVAPPAPASPAPAPAPPQVGDEPAASEPGTSAPSPRLPVPPTISIPVRPPVPPPEPPSVPPIPADRRAAEPERAPPSAAAESSGTAADVFAAANRARRAGDWGAAVALYEELRRRFPGSREEVLSRVTFGTLLLEVLGQPQRALGLFDEYLERTPGGSMAEEAIVGRAVALERLGREARERAAWEELLERFPGSAHAERARRRLEELP